MTPTIYPIHQAIGRPIIFKGLQAQYAILGALTLVGDFILFVILYLIGLNSWLDLLVTFGLGMAIIGMAYHLSNKYGEFGLMKKRARKNTPRHLRCLSRNTFLQLNDKDYVPVK